MQMGRLQGLLRSTSARWGGDKGVRRVMWAQGAGQELRVQEVQLGCHRQTKSLTVEVLERGHPGGACYNTECGILDALKFRDVGYRGVGGPDCRAIGDDWENDRLIGSQEGLLLVTPGGAGKSLQNLKAAGGEIIRACNVGGEGEHSVQSHPQNLGVVVKRDLVVIDIHDGNIVELLSPGSEKGDTGFCGLNKKFIERGPLLYRGDAVAELVANVIDLNSRLQDGEVVGVRGGNLGRCSAIRYKKVKEARGDDGALRDSGAVGSVRGKGSLIEARRGAASQVTGDPAGEIGVERGGGDF